MEKEYLDGKLGEPHEQKSENEWLEQVYNREFSRLQPIIDAIDTSPNGKININGYICTKSNGSYYIKAGKSGWIVIDSDVLKGNDTRGPINCKSIVYIGEVPLGQIRVSNDKNYAEMSTIGFNEVSSKHGKNTIIENAMNFHYNDPQTDKKRELSVQQILVMLKDLGVELTPTENMAMLRGKKQYLEAQLAEVNKELTQKESEQK